MRDGELWNRIAYKSHIELLRQQRMAALARLMISNQIQHQIHQAAARRAAKEALHALS